MITRQEFEIIWNSEDGQMQVPGVYVYGFFPIGEHFDIDDLLRRTVERHTVTCQTRCIDYEIGEVAKVALRFDSITNDESIWRGFLDELFSMLLHAGASVVWAGGVDCSSSPEVLNPASSVGNVYAAKSIESPLLCNSKLDEPIGFVTDEQLRDLWMIVSRGI